MSRFDPPYTTLSVGTIGGGTAINIIARECAFEWDLRSLPDNDPEALKTRSDAFIAGNLLPRMRASYSGHRSKPRRWSQCRRWCRSPTFPPRPSPGG